MYIQNVCFDEINYLEIALRMDILAWPKCNLTVKESISTTFGMAPPGSLFLSVQSACMRLEENIYQYKLAVRAGVVIIIILFSKAPLSSLLEEFNLQQSTSCQSFRLPQITTKAPLSSSDFVEFISPTEKDCKSIL